MSTVADLVSFPHNLEMIDKFADEPIIIDVNMKHKKYNAFEVSNSDIKNS